MPLLRCATLSLALLIAATAPAGAQRGETVVIVVPGSNDELMRQIVARMRGELQAAGFEVTVSAAPAVDDPRAAASVAARQAGSAAFVVQRPTGPASLLEIWLADSGRTLVRTVAVEPLEPERAALIAAVQAVELLRAAQAERWAPPLRALPPPPAPVVRVEAAPPAAFASVGFHAGLGGAALAAGGWSFAPMLAVGWGDRRGLALRAMAAAPASETEQHALAGIARVRPALALLELQLAFRPHRRLQPSLAAGAGALRITVDGQGFYPFHDRTAAAWSLVAGAGAGLALRLHARLALQFDARVFLSRPEQVIRLGDEDVARVGRPGWLLCAGLVGG